MFSFFLFKKENTSVLGADQLKVRKPYGYVLDLLRKRGEGRYRSMDNGSLVSGVARNVAKFFGGGDLKLTKI
jgi:hypothetical protein